MQQSPSASTPATGELIASFHHGKGFPIFILIVAIVMLGIATLDAILDDAASNRTEPVPVFQD